MVGLHGLGDRSGVRGKLTRDPAVHSAAVALLVGVTDPLGFLATDPADWPIVRAVVIEADRIKAERERDLAVAVADRTAARTVAGVAQVVRRALRALRR